MPAPTKALNIYGGMQAYPAPAPAVAGISQRAAEGLSAVSNTPSLYGGNARAVYQQYQADVNEIMSDFRGYLERKRQVAAQENFAAADALVAKLSSDELRRAGPAVRDLYAEIDARNKGALAAFREIAVQAGWARPDDSPFLQDEAAVRLFGSVVSADLWDKVSKSDVALDTAGLLFEPFADDSELPAGFTDELFLRFREMPYDQQLSALVLWREELVRARGNWFDIGVDNTPEARSNVLRVLSDLDKFLNPEAMSVGAEKWIDRVTSVLGVIDSAVLVAKVGRLAARTGNTLRTTVRESARRRQAGVQNTRTGITPDPEGPAGAKPASGNASRTAQEAQEGASGEGVARGVQGQETGAATEAPREPAVAVAAGENPEFQLDVEPGPFTKDDYRNFGTGGDVRQAARDRVAAGTGEVQQGQRVTRGALQQAAEMEESNRLAEASRNARIPREGEPFISDSPQLELDLARQGGRIEPTISPRDPNEAVVTYRNMDEILREPVIGDTLIGPLQGARAGEPVILPGGTVLDEQEQLGAAIGASAISSKGFAAATKTSQVDAVAQVVPGMEKLTDVSPVMGDKIIENLDPELGVLSTIKNEVYDGIRRIRGTDVGAYTATPGEVKRAIAKARGAYRKKLTALLEAQRGADVSIGMRKVSMRQLGDYEYEIKYNIVDLGSEDVKNPRILGQKIQRVVLGEEDIREAGQSTALVPKLAEWFRSPKSKFGMGTGRTVDLLVENLELIHTQTEAYRKVFASAIGKVFKGLTGKERQNVNAVLMRSQELGNGQLIPFSPQRLRGGIDFPDGSVITLNQKETQALYNFYELVEANTFVLNAMRTRALRANKVQRVNFSDLGDVYAREIGEKFIFDISNTAPANRPKIWNKAGAALKDGKIPKVLDWDGPFGYIMNFYKERHDFTVVRLNDNIEVDGEWFNLVFIRKDEVLDLPDVIPHHPLTWIPRVPETARYAVVRSTKGTLNGLPNKEVKARVIARAASEEEAQLYASRAGDGVYVQEDNVSRWTGDIDPYNSRVIPDDDYVEYLGPVNNLDPVQAVERSLQVLSRSIPMESFRRLQRARWMQAAKKAGVLESGGGYTDAVLKTKGLNPTQKRAASNLKKIKEELDQALGHRTEEERAWRDAVTWVADRITRNSEIGNKTAKLTYSIADKDPIGWVQGVTFHTQLGMTPAQFIVQSSNVVTAASLGYKEAARAVPLMNFVLQQRIINYGADAATAFKRQEELARQAVKLGYFDTPREYHSFIQAVNSSGRIEAVTNTADISMDVSDFHWMTRWKEKASDFNLFFYNQGVAMERAYSMSIAFLNYRRFMEANNDTRKVHELTRGDWIQILADQENLTLNMSKANKAGWQRDELWRIPTQFMQVMAKYYETALGTSRLITGEKSKAGHVLRMLGAQFAFFGMRGIVPVGAGGVSVMAYQMLTGMTPEEHSQQDPETAKSMFSALSNGSVNSFSQMLFGSELAISGRMSVNQGFSEIVNDVVINDKSMLSFLGGASGNWISTFANGNQEILIPLRVAAGEFHNPELALQLGAEAGDFISGVNNVKNAYDMFTQSKLRARSGVTILERDFSTPEILAQAAGIRLQDALDVPEAIMDTRLQEQRLTARAQKIAILETRAMEVQGEESRAALLALADLAYQGLNPAEHDIVAEKVNNIQMDPDSRFIRVVEEQIKSGLERTRAQEAVMQSNELLNTRSREEQQ
jgi:hypothetical protein